MIALANLEDIPKNGMLRVEAGGEAMILVRLLDDVFALSAYCPHRGGPMDEGDVDGTTVVCPWHGWEFDVRSGYSPTFDTQAETYPVEVRDGVVYLCDTD